ncbi:hypothetical protein DYB36_008112 [Aphanomyces astaci]|uniref:Cupin-like domain-containing protein n=1 Tax=Aphanomyces astaci TaxID=112090 RepID=A0A397A6X5_APHAT|nr:hypothetical protein DYB36_008112 [Aphanomyces astaci]
MSDDDHEEVPRIDAAALSYEAFCELYMAPNRPVLIRNIGSDWPIYHAWRRSEHNDVNHAYLRATFGHATVPVGRLWRRRSLHDATRWKKSFIVCWEEKPDVGFSVATYLTLLESGEAQAAQKYMKDWHFTRDFPHGPVYT